jgi:hypothetical protein
MVRPMALAQPWWNFCCERERFADVWDLRFHWRCERIQLEAELRARRFRFGPLSIVTKTDGEVLHL